MPHQNTPSCSSNGQDRWSTAWHTCSCCAQRVHEQFVLASHSGTEQWSNEEQWEPHKDSSSERLPNPWLSNGATALPHVALQRQTFHGEWAWWESQLLLHHQTQPG